MSDIRIPSLVLFRYFHDCLLVKIIGEVWIDLLILFSNDDTMEFSHVKFVSSRGDEVSAKIRRNEHLLQQKIHRILPFAFGT